VDLRVIPQLLLLEVLELLKSGWTDPETGPATAKTSLLASADGGHEGVCCAISDLLSVIGSYR
jgi:hypothetical protein